MKNHTNSTIGTMATVLFLYVPSNVANASSLEANAAQANTVIPRMTTIEAGKLQNQLYGVVLDSNLVYKKNPTTLGKTKIWNINARNPLTMNQNPNLDTSDIYKIILAPKNLSDGERKFVEDTLRQYLALDSAKGDTSKFKIVKYDMSSDGRVLNQDEVLSGLNSLGLKSVPPTSNLERQLQSKSTHPVAYNGQSGNYTANGRYVGKINPNYGRQNNIASQRYFARSTGARSIMR